MDYRTDAARRCMLFGAVVVAAGLAAQPAPASAQSGEPIKIGFSMALTGPLAPNGKQALLGAKIWEEEINAKGGLLGRKVELVNYDDQSNPANVPGIYTKLLDVDKVDIVMGPYATNMNAPAIPVVMQKGKTFIGFFALDVNTEFHYPKYFSMLPTGPKPREVVHRGLLPGGSGAKTETANDGADRPKMRNLRATPATARATTPKLSASRSSTTRPSRRARPISRRSSARCRPPMPISWLSAPIRSARSASCSRQTSWASSRRCSAAPWSDCRRPCSRTGSSPS